MLNEVILNGDCGAAAVIPALLARQGLHDVRFSERAPYWCAVGIKK